MWTSGNEGRPIPRRSARLREKLGEYSKRTIDAQHFPMSAIREAVARAETADTSPDNRWPQSTGTHVYKVVKKLM